MGDTGMFFSWNIFIYIYNILVFCFKLFSCSRPEVFWQKPALTTRLLFYIIAELKPRPLAQQRLGLLFEGFIVRQQTKHTRCRNCWMPTFTHIDTMTTHTAVYGAKLYIRSRLCIYIHIHARFGAFLPSFDRAGCRGLTINRNLPLQRGPRRTSLHIKWNGPNCHFLPNLAWHHLAGLTVLHCAT